MKKKLKLKNFPKKLIGEILNFPNLLTFARIVLIAPFVVFILKNNYKHAGIILVFSALTDFFDGFIAKITDQRTKFGAILDPVADKFTLLAVIICIGIKFSGITWFILILIAKELCMLFAGIWLLKNGKTPFRAKWYGKISTAFFYFSIIIIVTVKAIWGIENQFLINLLMIVNSILMMHSLFRYFIDFLHIF
ncbi:MAG: CDP-alcohol phosphatidyltransferase family protein [Oscillospiraceae bacterium]|jgi:cardiolipin synthase|nr:CDP-alcohol phosphatidyltransferase family protein [Oscillospiraceae bacterium]